MTEPGRRRVVAAASYEARQFGVHSAMASIVAARKCPGLIFAPPRFEVYRAVSTQIREIFAEHTDRIEPQENRTAAFRTASWTKERPKGGEAGGQL